MDKVFARFLKAHRTLARRHLTLPTLLNPQGLLSDVLAEVS